MILALDVGSSSVRACLFERASGTPDAHLTPVAGATAQRSHTFETAAGGQATSDAQHLRDLLEMCIDDVLQHPRAEHVSAVSMATFAGNWLSVNEGGEPLSPLFTYADTRSRAALDTLQQTLDSDTVQARTGTALRPAYYPAQIAYAQQTGLSIERVRDFATFCYERWFGRDVPLSYSLASWSGLLNRHTLAWDAPLLEALHLPAGALPSLADYTAAQRGLSAAYAQRWPLLQNVPFFLAVADGAAAQVGSGAVADNTAALTAGTTAALRYVHRRHKRGAVPDVPPGGWSYRIDADRHVTGGALSEGGNLFAWARDRLNVDGDTLNQALFDRAPGAHGLTVIPTFNGERSPGWQADSGTLHGLHLTTTPLDMACALLESVALRLAYLAQLLELPANTHLMASGGALYASEAWAQLIADALNRPLHLLDDPEVTAHGTAFLAEAALTSRALDAFQPAVKCVLKPRSEAAQTLEKLLSQQTDLYRRLYP
jgi:gluconokinase